MYSMLTEIYEFKHVGVSRYCLGLVGLAKVKRDFSVMCKVNSSSGMMVGIAKHTIINGDRCVCLGPEICPIRGCLYYRHTMCLI